ncbi:hypothetical protein ACLEPN_42500 [Myxococcus sp. 1LA]
MKKHLLSWMTGMCVVAMPAVSAAEEVWVTETQTLSTGGSYYWYTFTVTAGVWPVAPGHTVGMVYSNDLWHTSH